jgi:hypothetical protein
MGNVEGNDSTTQKPSNSPPFGGFKVQDGTINLSDEKDRKNRVQKQIAPFEKTRITTETNAFVTRFHTTVTGTLAIGLWFALILAGVWHALTISSVSRSLLEHGVSPQVANGNAQAEIDFEAYDKASAMVGDTATTMYAVLSPLATAATGFYFASKSTMEDQGDDTDV